MGYDGHIDGMVMDRPPGKVDIEGETSSIKLGGLPKSSDGYFDLLLEMEICANQL